MKHFLCTLAFFACAAQAQPVLQMQPPQGFTGSLGRDPAAHVSKEGDAIVTVYPFKALQVPFEEAFRATLLRERIQEDRQERKLAGAPEIHRIAVPGAQDALFAKFVEDRSGTLRYRLRVAILAAGAVAIVDYDADGPKAYMGHWPVVSTALESMKVSKPRAAAAKAKAGAPTGK